MDLLFKREQTTSNLGRVNFKLWGKIDLDEDETVMVNRYRLNEAVLIEAIQPTLLRNTIIIAVLVFVFALSIFTGIFGAAIGPPLSLAAAAGAGYWYFNEKRETIFVKDLIHGRHFKCDSVVELARKEAWLETITAFLRQVMESAKHWDGTSRHPIEPLPQDEARQVIIKGL